jgi:hypothetical protein
MNRTAFIEKFVISGLAVQIRPWAAEEIKGLIRLDKPLFYTNFFLRF